MMRELPVGAAVILRRRVRPMWIIGRCVQWHCGRPAGSGRPDLPVMETPE